MCIGEKVVEEKKDSVHELAQLTLPKKPEPVESPGFISKLYGGIVRASSQFEANVTRRNEPTNKCKNPFTLLKRKQGPETFIANDVGYKVLVNHRVDVTDFINAGWSVQNMLALLGDDIKTNGMKKLKTLGLNAVVMRDNIDMFPLDVMYQIGYNTKWITDEFGVRFDENAGLVGPAKGWSLADSIVIGLDTPEKLKQAGLKTRKQWRRSLTTEEDARKIGWTIEHTRALKSRASKKKSAPIPFTNVDHEIYSYSESESISPGGTVHRSIHMSGENTSSSNSESEQDYPVIEDEYDDYDYGWSQSYEEESVEEPYVAPRKVKSKKSSKKTRSKPYQKPVRARLLESERKKPEPNVDAMLLKMYG